jgi:hypothetical protein
MTHLTKGIKIEEIFFLSVLKLAIFSRLCLVT